MSETTKPRSSARRSRTVVHLQPRHLLKDAPPDGHHPTVRAEAEHRAASVQLRVADAITAFAGSMWFVYLHIVLFAVWMLWFEESPWPTLTLIVSLEAIFLSTFVMIGQNRQAAFQQAKADHDYESQEKLLIENTTLTRVIHELSQEIHARIVVEVDRRLAAAGGASAPAPDSAASPDGTAPQAG